MRLKFQLRWSIFIAFAVVTAVFFIYSVSTLAKNVGLGATLFAFLFLSTFSFLGLGWARLRRALALGIEIEPNQSIESTVFRHLIGPVVPAIWWLFFTIAGVAVLLIVIIVNEPS